MPPGIARPRLHGSFAGPVLLLVLACTEPGTRNGDDISGGRGTPAAGVEQARTTEGLTGGLIDATDAAGIDCVHHNGARGAYHIAELMGSGVALFDLEGDGDLDLYCVDGGSVDGGSLPGDPPRAPRDRLYRNESRPGEASPHFVDITATSGLEHRAGNYGMGVAVGDVDGDGLADLLRTALGPPSLWRNLGGGRFESWSDTLPPLPAWTVPATFFDFEGDGDLDLFVGGYLDPESGPEPPCSTPSGQDDYCGARHYRGLSDHLLENLGPGDDGRTRWRDVSAAAGIAGPTERALGAIAADLAGDSRPELFVANDAGPNHLWQYSAQGSAPPRFEDVALLAGVAVNGAGASEASMGIAVADPDGDADLDLFLTHLVVETHTYYRQRSPGLFEDATAAVGLAAPSRPHTGFGTAWLDADGDGRLDLYVANGAVQRRSAQQAAGTDPFAEVDQLFLGRGDGSFGLAVGAGRGPGARPLVSRGVAAGDVDNDGDLDLVVSANGGPIRLLLSTADPGRWYGLRLLHRSGAENPPRHALGTTVEWVTDQRRVIHRVTRDGSYASSSDPRVLFIPASGETLRRLVVTRPGGEPTEVAIPEPGRYSDLELGDSELANLEVNE